jgi:hypothetical protein
LSYNNGFIIHATSTALGERYLPQPEKHFATQQFDRKMAIMAFFACNIPSQSPKKRRAASLRTRPKFREETPVTRQKEKSISLSSVEWRLRPISSIKKGGDLGEKTGYQT